MMPSSGIFGNRKLIGARYYTTDEAPFTPTARSNANSARDEQGHGTHTASTAAGNSIAGASYYGLASGSNQHFSSRICFQLNIPTTSINNILYQIFILH
jgi:subtilisin family serine protease